MPGTSRAGRGVRAATVLGLVLVMGCGPSPAVTAAPGSETPGSEAPATGAHASARASLSPSEPPAALAQWRDCGKGFLCASLPVPRDYATGAAQVNISLIRHPAKDKKARIGSLVINPGGPGGSGVDFVRQGIDVFPRALLDRFDLVGFDPRGVNSSTAIRCIDNLDGRATLDPSPDDAAELQALADSAKSYADACAKRNGAILPFVSTDAVVQDLDRIRAAIGDTKLTYMGFSYGTLIGALYADRYPDRVRAMVLDGPIDPALDLAHFRAGQARAFETSLGHFLTDCADDSTCAFHEGGATAKAFDALMRSLDAHPIPAPRAAGQRTVGPGLAASAVLSAMYSKAFWPVLASALKSAQGGDGSLLVLLSDPLRGRKSDGSYSNLQDAYTANTCLDFPAPHEVADYTRWARALAKDAPHFAQQVAYNDLPCAFWPVPAERTPGPVRAAGAPPIVVVGSTGDPATPYAWAKALAGELESGRLVTRRGEGHTAYLQSGCIQKALDPYLLELKVPATDLTCG